MKYNIYRDKGIIRGFKDTGADMYFLDDNSEVCLDERLESETKGRWFLGHPNTGRLLSNEEVDYIVPSIIRGIELDIEFKKDYLKSCENNKNIK